MAKRKQGELRIIAGKWRGRKIHFPAVENLRPTTDRIRETLFNWLAVDIQDATCLDLFAGSGALGFEALSRGAKQVTFVDANREVVKQLQANCDLLGAENARVVQARIPSDLTISETIDIVFLDPPFRQNLLVACCEWLERQTWLSERAIIYIEAEKKLQPLVVPPNWNCRRSKEAGQVSYGVFERL